MADREGTSASVAAHQVTY
ncbi:hypothetical protein E2C01_065218 [Portunus trituberculatus]|uniref:Uncharacterized protein n=1 Tax=Portunus trituberculatus TaxID=210409 RepID=A0A5B7HI94_PORTR|nr:hypothetical protein [Portunus trituberculatus]